MKLLIENFQKFLSEDNDQKPPAEIIEYLGQKGYHVDQYLGGGKYGSVYQIESKEAGQRLAVKVVESIGGPAVTREVANYEWVKDNRSRLPGEVSKHLPEVYLSETVPTKLGDYGVIIMELLNPDIHKLNMALFLGGAEKDPKTGEERMKHWSRSNRAERLLGEPSMRESIIKDIFNNNPSLGMVFYQSAGYEDDPDYLSKEDFEKILGALVGDASGKFSDDLFTIQKARRTKRELPKPNLPDIDLEELKKSEFLAQLFVQRIIDAFDNSELLEKMKQTTMGPYVVRSLRDSIQPAFIKQYKKSVATLGPESERAGAMDFYYQQGKALEAFPELKGLANALIYLDEKEGFKAKDVHAMNVMYSKKTNEMVVVDLGLFQIQAKPKPVQQQQTPSPSFTDPFEMVFENFKKFLNEEVDAEEAEEVDAEEMETLTHLARNGDCGMFAIALLKELISAGITNAALILIGDPDQVDDPDYHSNTTPRNIKVWYDVDIFHVVVTAVEGGAWGMFDIKGRVSQDKMLEYFVPYGGGGITPDDYTPQYGRDWISDVYDVPSIKALSWFQDFLEATTNVQTSVENYTKTAQRMAKSILKN